MKSKFINRFLLFYSLCWFCISCKSDKNNKGESKSKNEIIEPISLLEKVQGTWIRMNLDETSDSMKIQGNTLMFSSSESFLLRLNADSLWLTSQILDSSSRLRNKPKIGLYKLRLVSEDSLVLGAYFEFDNNLIRFSKMK